MQSCLRPVQTGLRRLAAAAAYSDPSITAYDFEQVVPDDADEFFQLELEATRRYGNIDLPSNTFLCVKSTRYSQSMICAGFRLSTL